MKFGFILPFKLLFTDPRITPDITFFSVLLICLPIALITGPALPDIFLSLLALYFLIKSIWQKLWQYYKNPVVIGFLLFSFYGIIRSLLSDIPLVSLTNEGSVFYFRYIFFSMCVWYLLDNCSHLSKCLLSISLVCLVIVSLDGFYQYFNLTSFFGNIENQHFRLTGMMGKEPILGRYIAYLSIFVFALIYQNFKKTKIMMALSVLFLVMCEVIVFLTGERAPLFYVSLFTILIIFFIPHYKTYRLVGVFISVFIIFGILQINPSAKIRMIDDTIDQISKTKLPFLPYSHLHEKHYLSALKLFKDNPVFGVGTNTYPYRCDNNRINLGAKCNTHPHHFYIQTLAELGIVGFVFLLFFFFYLTFIGLRQIYFILFSYDKNIIPFEAFLYPMILFVYWWPLIPHMSLYNNWNNVLLMLPLGFFMKYYYEYKINLNDNKN